MNRRHALKGAAASVAILAMGDVAFAQSDNWPARPITMIVPASAGSGTDLMAREIAQRLGAALKQPVVVDNKPGASGVLGTQAVVRAPADGYTILYNNGSNSVMAPALVKSIPYDVQRDLAPIAQSATGGVILSVSPDFPATNLGELIQHVKANPNKYSYGTWAVGSSGHLMMEWLKRQTGMQMTHVPYKQVPQLLTELSTGVLKIGWTDPASPLPFIESGKIRAIAVSGASRLPRTPDVPTMGEQGHAFESVGWFGVFAPAATPPAIIQRLSDEINRIHAQPEMAAKMEFLNVGLPQAKTPEQFRSIIGKDMQTWKKIVTDSGITLDN
jgi:tripartite-type tricarboxylate transporter receptor subunit TctC